MSWKSGLAVTAKLLCVLGLLYLFICSLDMLSLSFRLVTGEGTSKELKDAKF